MKAAKLLRDAENRITRDATASARHLAVAPLDLNRAVVGDTLTAQNQQQFYRFHFNELTARIHQLKHQLNATQLELMEQMKISHDLSVNYFISFVRRMYSLLFSFSMRVVGQNRRNGHPKQLSANETRCQWKISIELYESDQTMDQT